jgi:hypothetical protein
MLAYMVRTLIEKGRDRNIKNRAALYKNFIGYILGGYEHEKAKLSRHQAAATRSILGQISYDALAAKDHMIQKIPADFCWERMKGSGVRLDDLPKYGLVNLIVERSGGNGDFLYFTHQSFQEFLAAKWAARSRDKVSHILDEIWNPKWREVIKFLAGLLGEKFVKQIYSRGCKDNCLHSRLFLAAECCKELGKEIQIEKRLFVELTKLTQVSPFEKDAIIAISCLSIPEAVDFSVHLIPKSMYRVWHSGFVAGIPPSVLLNSLNDIAQRLQPRHLNEIIDYIGMTDDISQYERAKLLDLVAEHLSTGQITKLLGILCSDEELLDIIVVWTKLNTHTITEHVNYIIKLCQSENRNIRQGAFQLLYDIFYLPKIYQSHVGKIVEFCVSDDPDMRSRSALLLVKVGNELSSENAGKLFGLLRDHPDRPVTDVLSVLSQCVSEKDIPSELVDRVIGFLTDPDAHVRNRAAHAIVCWHGDNKDKLSLAQVGRIAKFLELQDITMKCEILQLLGHICDGRHHECVSKAITLICDNSPDLQIAGLEMFERIAQRGYSGLVADSLDLDRVIDLMKNDNVDISSEAVRLLRLLRNHLENSQISKIIYRICHINRDLTEFPLPDTLSEPQICQVLNLLKTRNGSGIVKTNLINVLRTQKEALDRHADDIINLLDDCEPAVGGKTLALLSDVSRLSESQLLRVIQSARHLGHAFRICDLSAHIKERGLSKVTKDAILGLLNEVNPNVQIEILDLLEELQIMNEDDVTTKYIELFKSANEYIQYSILRAMHDDIVLLKHEHINRIMNYLSDETVYFYPDIWNLLFDTMKKNKLHRSNETYRHYIDKALIYIETNEAEKWNRSAILLNYTSDFLTDQDVCKIIIAYVTNCPAQGGVLMDLHPCLIPKKLLFKQIELLVDLLGKTDEVGQQRILEFLFRVKDKLEPCHIKGIAKVFEKPECNMSVREKVYNLLKSLAVEENDT